MKLAIVGSRNYPKMERVSVTVRAQPKGMTIVSGGAKGVDEAAERAARAFGYSVWPIKVDPAGLPEDGATGPLIERYGIQVSPPVHESHQYTAEMMEWVARAREREDGTWEYGKFGRTALIAVCNLLLSLHAAGKLEAK